MISGFVFEEKLQKNPQKGLCYQARATLDQVHLVLRLCGFKLCGSLFMRKLGRVKKIFGLCVFAK